MFEKQIVSFSQSAGSISLIGATVLLDVEDRAGVHIAANNLAQDFARVTKGDPSPLKVLNERSLSNDTKIDRAIMIGCIESSRLIQRLQHDGKINVESIRGKWEAYLTAVVENPLPWCEKALVIAGSDKRGTIFGTYTLSEQIGVSPWYWWADVAPKLHAEIYALPVSTSDGEPSIKYRGIFINDEAPALTGWVLEKYGKYGCEFYKHVFELLLRLKANFMWPAMWPGYPNPGASFFTDDENQKLAEDYGVCISTSHHEPMQRLSNEWFTKNEDGSWDWLRNKENVRKFFEEGAQRAKGHESYFTLGMRGEYDRKMATDDPAAVVKDVIANQRAILKNVYGAEDSVPQLLALYKEVLDQFESGRLEVPDDVTLLFADDNHGTLRRLPSGKEFQRKGGAGIYYHFEYVGIPRSYKWINSNSLGKVWHQLQEAYRRHARQIWVFNVGDIKPIEIPMTFAFSLAWNIDSVQPDNFSRFFQVFAEREFGSDLADEVAEVWHEYDRLASLRKHEQIEADTFSLLHYNEAEKVLERWKTTLERAQAIYDRVSEDQKAAAFELVLHPVKASYIYVALRIAQGKNKLYARQRRNTANPLAQKVLKLFDDDFTLQEEFHSLLHGKWNQMLRQTHFGYEDTWHAPSRDMISGLCYVQRRQDSNPIVGQMGVAVEDHEGVRPGRINEESERTHPSRRDLVPGVTLQPMNRYSEPRWFEIFTRGTQTIHWRATSPHSWIELSTTSGRLEPDSADDACVEITIDWDQVPADFDQEVLIDIRSDEGDFEQIHLPLQGHRVDEDFKHGFVESSRCVSVPASACAVPSPYTVLPETGREIGGSIALSTSSSEAVEIPWLTYKLYTFTETPSAKVLLLFTTTLDVDPTDLMSYEVQVDDGEIQSRQLVHKRQLRQEEVMWNVADYLQVDGWFDAAQDGVWKRWHEWKGQTLKPGSHTIQVRFRHTNMSLEKLVLDLGGVRDSYLGPPESYRV
ncbi:hypothetical protein F5Y15DRAFT_342294 [Xylariaceae sp. FL0016]|nr:hypothetical protein F5Y15DRAFT_342294 [Xylariaceae sp. FL0016]